MKRDGDGARAGKTKHHLTTADIALGGSWRNRCERMGLELNFVPSHACHILKNDLDLS